MVTLGEMGGRRPSAEPAFPGYQVEAEERNVGDLFTSDRALNRSNDTHVNNAADVEQ
jgi:hypothetical protein